MKSPDAPYLEFGFYFESLQPLDAFRLVVAKTASLRAVRLHKAASVVRVTSGSDDVESHLDGEFIEMPIKDACDLEGFLLSTGGVISKLTISGLLNIVPGTYEFIVPNIYPILNSKGAVVSVWSDGAWLSSGPGACNQRRRERGAKALALFREMVSLLDPSYAAITVDYTLETPEQLRSDPRSLSFRDFYLSRQYLTPSVMTAFATNYSSFQQESIDDGRLFLCSTYLVDEGNIVDSHICYEASVFVGKEIAMLVSNGGKPAD